MPVVAVVGGIATAAGAAAGATALIGGTITLSTIASGLAFVGGVASALGAVTGNKKLMKFGMIAGVAGLAAGGINSLMSNGAGEASKFALTPGAAGAEGVATSTADAGMQAISSGVDGTALRMSDMSLAPGADIGKGLSSVETGAGLLSEAPAQSAYTTGTSYALKDPAAINNLAGGGVAPNTSNVLADAANKLRVPVGDVGGGALSNFGQWMNQNKELVKAGTGMLGGLGQGYMEQEKMKEMERLRAQDRTRINASIMGQRARY